MQGIMCMQEQANGLREVMDTKRLEVNPRTKWGV